MSDMKAKKVRNTQNLINKRASQNETAESMYRSQNTRH